MATGTSTNIMPKIEATTDTHVPSLSIHPQNNNEDYALSTLSTPSSNQDCSAPSGSGNPEPDQRGPRFIPHDVVRSNSSIEVEYGFIPHNVRPSSGTEVDVVLVPCPGADPLKTWVGKTGANLWAYDGIRNQAPLAYFLTYDHGDVKEAWSLKTLATDLLRLLFEERSLGGKDTGTDLKRNTRPLFFICHSIGGLVVKLALTEARRHHVYRPIVDSCHGITFFATPHHGSTYFFTDDFKFSIQEILNLRAPLPFGLTKELNLGDFTLQKVDENFKQLAGELKLWTFYETEDSLLFSISHRTGLKETQYTAPITPMRSAILGASHEKIYGLRSTHAECAWLEDHHIQSLYLHSLCSTIREAGWIHRRYPPSALSWEVLEKEVMVEVHGSYEKKMPERMKPIVPLLSVKQSLERFLAWGPDALLDERLVNRQPMGAHHGPMAGRKFVWRDSGLNEGVVSPSDPRQGRRQCLPSIAEDQHVPDEPRIEDKKFAWIHVPFNNPVWVRKVFKTLSVHDATDYDELFSAPHWGSRHTRGRHDQHHACFLEPTCSKVSIGEAPVQNCRYLYLPYLHFDSYKEVIKRGRVITQRLEQGRTNPVAVWVLDENSLEFKVTWAFLGHDPPINCRRTLDQYKYPSIHDTRRRDDDQILYKLTKQRDPAGFTSVRKHTGEDGGKHSYSAKAVYSAGYTTVRRYTGEDSVLNGNLLLIDQLWMWIMETPDRKSRLLTFYPRRDGSPAEGTIFGQADLRDITYGDLNAGLAQQCTTASDLAALTILNAVTALIDRSTDPNLDIFRIFEEAVGILTETMTSSLKRFGMSAFSTKYKYRIIEAMESLSIRDRHRLEVEMAREESRNSTSTLLELRDVEDELKSLLNLFGEQQDHVRTFLEISEPKVFEGQAASQHVSGVSLTSSGRYFLIEALEKLKAYKSQVQDMIDRVEKAIRDFDRLLEIVQKQTQLEEGYVSRHQADLAKVQNRSVIIFTVFSVVFLPLSFFTSVFGMNTREWGGGDNLSLSTIFSIGIPISVTLIAGTVITAWIIAEGAGYDKVVPAALRGRQKAREKTSIMGQQSGEIFNPDFWERNRLKINARYEIPLENLKYVTVSRRKAAEEEEKGMEVVDSGDYY